MYKKTLIAFVYFLNSFCSFAQELIDITDQTVKIGGMSEEELYFGFAEGDKIIFNFLEVDKKELKEIEIIEYPNNSKFSEFKSKNITNKSIQVNRKGVYIFRFKNSAMTGRVCKIRIQRIAANEATKNFNSSIKWVVKQDTSWNVYTKDIVVGHDTSYVPKTKKVLLKSETKEMIIMDKSQKVHSYTNENGNKSELFFSLPANEITDLKTREVVSWGYWVGVDESGSKAWNQNAQKIAGLTTKAASLILSPLGALAIGSVANLVVPTSGEDVFYYIAAREDRDLFWANQSFKIYDEGKGMAGYKLFTSSNLMQGTYFILLKNDNDFVGIDVNVKVSAMIETKVYEYQKYTEMQIKPRYEKKIFKDPMIASNKIPVIEE